MSDAIFHFFGLRENPFKISPDPRFLFVTEQAQAASAELAYAIRTRKGLILLTGEVGTGKTVLLRHLLNWLGEQKMPTALIFNSHIKPEHLLDLVLNDFGVPCTSTLKSEKLIALNRWLLEQYRAGQIPVLIVDEAQGLDPTTLEQIRLLLNFETPREKLLQIVLAGQPELEVKLKAHELRQLRQRITIRCRTHPLTLEQTHGYIRERLRVAGANGNPIFEPDAVGSVHAYSHGIPRVINVLCEHSLFNACADGSSMVAPEAVERAAQDCQLDRADSVARILNTGSYSTTSLSDIGAMLAAISAGSDSPAEPRRAAEPPPTVRVHTPAPPATAAYARTSANHAPEQEPSWNEVSPVVAETSQASFAETETMAELDGTVMQDASDPSPARRARTVLATLQGWSRSFASDARATSRQVSRAIRSFEARHWKPLIRLVERELVELRVRAARVASDPRWKQMGTRLTAAGQDGWRRVRAMLPAWIAEPRGEAQQQKSRNRARKTPANRANRPRAILYLRRWLHQPLETQQKRSHSNSRHF